MPTTSTLTSRGNVHQEKKKKDKTKKTVMEKGVKEKKEKKHKKDASKHKGEKKDKTKKVTASTGVRTKGEKKHKKEQSSHGPAKAMTPSDNHNPKRSGLQPLARKQSSILMTASAMDKAGLTKTPGLVAPRGQKMQNSYPMAHSSSKNTVVKSGDLVDAKKTSSSLKPKDSVVATAKPMEKSPPLPTAKLSSPPIDPERLSLKAALAPIVQPSKEIHSSVPAPNIDEVLRLGSVMERQGLSREKKLAFEWVALNRHHVSKQPLMLSAQLNTALGDVEIEKDLAIDSLGELLYHQTLTPDEYTKISEILQGSTNITVGKVAFLLRTEGSFYKNIAM